MWDPTKDPIAPHVPASCIVSGEDWRIHDEVEAKTEEYKEANYCLMQIQGGLKDALQHIFEYENNLGADPNFLESESSYFYELSYVNYCKRMEIRDMLVEISQKMFLFESTQISPHLRKFLEIVEV